MALILDSVTHLTGEHRGRAVYCASHGGIYAAFHAATLGIGAVILNDAGVGLDRAGIAGLALLDDLGVPAAAISSQSARIGDGADGLARGVLSYVNGVAQRHGLAAGMACRQALELLNTAALRPAPMPRPIEETRFEIEPEVMRGVRVIGADSVSLVRPEDRGQIFINGSHGGLLGGKPETAIKVDVFAAVYNDAGIGVDEAGISRLPALQTRGIAGACVSCLSARIGDGRSTYADGVISRLNARALQYGGRVGQSCRTFVAAMCDAHSATSRGRLQS